MSKEEKIVNMDGTPIETEDIKGTDFVEPQGKGRKVIKWIISGAALVLSAVVGGIIGHNIGKDDEDDKDASETSEETAGE